MLIIMIKGIIISVISGTVGAFILLMLYNVFMTGLTFSDAFMPSLKFSLYFALGWTILSIIVGLIIAVK